MVNLSLLAEQVVMEKYWPFQLYSPCTTEHERQSYLGNMKKAML